MTAEQLKALKSGEKMTLPPLLGEGLDMPVVATVIKIHPTGLVEFDIRLGGLYLGAAHVKAAGEKTIWRFDNGLEN